MSLGPLRALAQAVSVGVLGVPATVTRPFPDETPVTTTAVWLPPPPEEAQPVGTDFRRREPRRLLALPRDAALPSMPRGTVISAPEDPDGAAQLWRVDELALTQYDQWRVLVVRTS